MKTAVAAPPPPDEPTPAWKEKVQGYLLWAVHVAAQNEPDVAVRNNHVQSELLSILAWWDR